ncbi:hypothetical protein L3X38_000735 [Prunus dulcis]|uniref:Uncharacterized protein n=1 Tax=Prunus dulcis TaxID=3755 RepID=A0AAD4WR96_PRUDU|nr:hypothetical protein L3X38_000735 [Prunus dulcis]
MEEDLCSKVGQSEARATEGVSRRDPVFHVSNLKPYHADPEEPSREESQRTPSLMVTSFDREVECIMAKREVRRKGVPSYFEYFVK